MNYIKKTSFFIFIYSTYFASGLASSSDLDTETKAAQKASQLSDEWKADRFFPFHKDNKKTKQAAIKLGFNLKFVEFSLENSNIAQSGITTPETGPSTSMSEGSTVNFAKKFSPSYEVLFAYKSDSDFDAPIFGVNFWFFEQKPINHSFTAKTDLPLTSTYHISQNTFANNIEQVNADMNLKMRILKIFITKYLFSSKHFFFNSGFGTNILIADHERNISYDSGDSSHCLCLTQRLKGADLHLMTNLGINATNSFGLEVYYETGIFINKHSLSIHSWDQTPTSENQHAKNANSAHDINQMQRISVLLAYNNFQFSQYHHSFKFGFELLSLQADKMAKSIGESYSDTKSFYLPSVFISFDIYI